MTEANGTRDNLNSSNGSSAASEQTTQPATPWSEAPSHDEIPGREIPGRIERPPLKIVSDKGVSKTLSASGRLGRRDSATPRKRTKGAAKESRRRTASGKAPSKLVPGKLVPGKLAGDKTQVGRPKRLAGSATSENLRRRSRQSGSRTAALTLTKGSGTRANAKCQCLGEYAVWQEAHTA